MKTGLVLTFGSFGFMVLLMVSYFLQQQNNKSLGRKLYRLLIYNIIVLLVTEIIAALYSFLPNSIDFIKILFLRLHWFTGIAWFWVLYLYSVCFLKNSHFVSVRDLIRKDNRCKYFTIFTIICVFIYMFLPFKDMTYETYTFIPGLASYFTISYCVVSVTLIVLLLIRRRNDVDSRSRNAVIIVLVEMIIIVLFQAVFQRTAVFGLGAGLQLYFLYFYIENPDLMMVNDLEKLKVDIEKSSLAKSDFLSNMSHEIRSPMNAIVGFSETILNNPDYDPEQTKSDIEHIATSGNNLLDIINNILDISKIESGSETLDQKEYSVGNVIMELGSIIEARLANRPIKFIAEVDSDIPSKVYGDSTKLFQVLLNILTNSIKYTEVGRIRLDATKDIKNNDVTLKFKITDTGYGIKQEDYDKLFEKFSRLTSATTNEIEGTGLGLVITKKYVDLLGGKIWFESDYGVGTTFYVEVTQKIVDPTPIGDIREGSKQGDDIDYLDCTGKKVLVVDDNELNLKVARKVLEKYKFEIDTINNGKDCVYRIKEGQHYDIIFLDHMMPEMDGIEVVHILKKLADYKIPPIVALTANAITGVREMYLREGFDEYLSKPINRSELNRIINKFFK
jgi:signal transduction histidine kinase/CheY-like chemotaxis protein